MYDLIIIGGGPAGMTAAVYAARKKLNTLLVSKDIGGQLLWTMGVENYMGYQFIEGPELMQKFDDQVSRFPIDQKIGQGVTSLNQLDGGFEVRTESGETHRARAVIIATGKRPAMLNVPGEERLKGRGVSYCATCDGPLFAGEKVVIAGGGNSALEAASDMVRIAEHVSLVSTTRLTGDQVLIDKLRDAANMTHYPEHEITEIEGEKRVQAVKIRDCNTNEVKRLDAAAVFIEIGLVPNSEFARDIVKLNEIQEIEASCTCETGVPGLFASGDVTNVPEKQIVVAAGEGAKASLQAHRYLQRL